MIDKALAVWLAIPRLYNLHNYRVLGAEFDLESA